MQEHAVLSSAKAAKSATPFAFEASAALSVSGCGVRFLGLRMQDAIRPRQLRSIVLVRSSRESHHELRAWNLPTTRADYIIAISAAFASTPFSL